MQGIIWNSFLLGRLKGVVLISDQVLGFAGIGWPPGTGGRDDEARLGLLLDEGSGFEDLADFTKPSGRVRFAMPTGVNEVFTKFLAVHVMLDSPL